MEDKKQHIQRQIPAAAVERTAMPSVHFSPAEINEVVCLNWLAAQ